MTLIQKTSVAALLTVFFGTAGLIAPSYAANASKVQEPIKTGTQDQQCGQPACYAGDDGTKSCYICEYGKLTQHTVCVQKNSKQDREYGIIQDQNKSKEQCPSVKQDRRKSGWQQN